MRRILTSVLLVFMAAFGAMASDSSLKDRLEAYCAGKDARIGVAVIIGGEDTVAVNGGRDFPMLSVYKFPQALAVADYCGRHGISFGDTIDIAADEIKTNTYSPMRGRYGVRNLRMSINDLLEYSLQQSDNNACDILFRLIGGPEAADAFIKSIGFSGISIATTEDQMQADPYLCYLNRTTPLEMAALFNRFAMDIRHISPLYMQIDSIVGSCQTGLGRLPAGMPENSGICHKTGTGGLTSQGRLMAVNDAGYVVLPGTGRMYSIAVFVADSAYDMVQTEKIIADISAIVSEFLSEAR